MKAFSQRSTLGFTAALALSISSICFSNGAGDKPKPGFILDRLSVILTGRSATRDEIADFESGKKTLAQLAETYRKHPGFEDQLAKYWNNVFRINGPLGWTGFKVLDNAKNPVDIALFYSYRGGLDPNDEKRGMRSLGANCLKYADSDVENPYNYLDVPIGDVFPPERLRKISVENGCGCEATSLSNPVPVVPWWNPYTKVLACPALTDADICGPNLTRCWSSYPVADMVGASMTLEPGYMVAKTVIEDRPWREILTTKRGAGNAAFLTFASNPNFHYHLSKLVDAPDPYPGIQNNPYVQVAKADPTGKKMLETTGLTFAWYDRADFNSGVLTTPVFVRNANGHRAYANVSRQFFLCKKFVVPEGVKQVISDEQDLTKKPYCSSCHVTLEPLSKFFGHLPKVGEATYYFQTFGRTVNGEYEGKKGEGIHDLARIFTESPDFSSCAVKRAFEFVMKRPMTVNEETQLIPQLTALYQDQGEKVWPVMLSIINSPLFYMSGR